MAIITNYASLQTAVGDYLSRDDLTSYIPNFIQNAENKLYRRLNLRNEETALSVSIASGVAAVPADFKALKFAYYNETPVRLLQWVPVEELYRDYPDRSDTGSPSVISREGANFVFGKVAADGTLTGSITLSKIHCVQPIPAGMRQMHLKYCCMARYWNQRRLSMTIRVYRCGRRYLTMLLVR